MLSGASSPAGRALLHLGDHQVGSRGHRPVEVLLGHPVDQVANRIRAPRPDQRHIRPQRRLKHVQASADPLGLLSFGQHSARRRGRVEAADPRAARPDRLGHRPLRHHLKLNRARLGRRHRLRVAREKRSDRLPDLAVAQHPPPAQPRLAHIVGDVREIAYLRLGQSVQNLRRIARHAKAAHQDRVARLDQAGRCLRADLRKLLHQSALSTTVASP